jgi:hypothetical protein
MKILLDECIPRKFKGCVPQRRCQTVPEAGFAGKLAEDAGFQVFVTLDQGIEHEQNLAQRDIAVVLLFGRSSRLEDLLPLASACAAALASIRPGQLLKVGR